MLIKVKLGSLLGIVIQPFNTQIERENIVNYLSENSLINCGFHDLTTTDDIYALIKLMERVGRNIILYIDHHENPEKHNENSNALGIYEIINNKNFRIIPRDNAPSATGLVKANEAKQLGLDVFFTHYDIDGFCGLIKASELGSRYSWLDDVANLAEKGGSNGKPLSSEARRFLVFMQKGLNLGPPYQFDHDKRNIALQELYTNMCSWLYNDLDDKVIIDFINELEEVNEDTTELSKKILQDTLKIDDGIVFVDAYDYMFKGKRPNFNYLKKELFRLASDYMLVAIRVLGHKGDQISVYRSQGFNINLPYLMPLEEFNDWHIESRIHFKTKNFVEFKENYLKAQLVT